MAIYIALLRGINVSGQKQIKMTALKDMCAEMGFDHVQTYIQSGNIIFESQETITAVLENKISHQIATTFQFAVPVLVMTCENLKQIIQHNPFVLCKNEDVTKLYITLLSQVPLLADINHISSGQYHADKFMVKGKAIYLYCANGYGTTKLTNTFFETKLKVTATTRNWKTINELYRIASNVIKA